MYFLYVDNIHALEKIIREKLWHSSNPEIINSRRECVFVPPPQKKVDFVLVFNVSVELRILCFVFLSGQKLLFVLLLC